MQRFILRKYSYFSAFRVNVKTCIKSHSFISSENQNSTKVPLTIPPNEEFLASIFYHVLSFEFMVYLCITHFMNTRNFDYWIGVIVESMPTGCQITVTDAIAYRTGTRHMTRCTQSRVENRCSCSKKACPCVQTPCSYLRQL